MNWRSSGTTCILCVNSSLLASAVRGLIACSARAIIERIVKRIIERIEQGRLIVVESPEPRVRHTLRLPHSRQDWQARCAILSGDIHRRDVNNDSP